MKKIFLLCFFPMLLYSQTEYRFFVNNLDLTFNNKGMFGFGVQPGYDCLGYFNGCKFLFSSGFMVSGYDGDSLWSCGQAQSSMVWNFRPGNVDSNYMNLIYKIYVNENNANPDYPAWQDYVNAVNTGADFYDGNGDGIYDPTDQNGNNIWDPNEDKPDIIGDLTAWCVYNDAIPESLRIRFPGVDPVGLEIRQTVFGFSTISSLENVVFIRYDLINSGKVNTVLDSVYFSSWADPDIGNNYQDDLFGSDTLRQSIFIYSEEDIDPCYGSAIPSFFTRCLEGPKSYIPGETFTDNNSNGVYDEGIDTALDTAISRRGKDIGVQYYPGAKNCNVSSSIVYISSDPLRGDPLDKFEARNYMKGLLNNGQILNPCGPDCYGNFFGGGNCNSVNPLLWYSGDPLTQTGWLGTNSSDMLTMINTGPFKLEVGKPVSIIVAYIVGQGTDRLNSITKAREIAEYTHNFYLSNFGEFPVSVDEDPISKLPIDFKLEQNLPKPI